MAHKCPHCPRKYNSAPAMMRHKLEDHPEATEMPRRKGWATPHGFVDFAEPVTYEEACEVSAVFNKAFRKKNEESR